MRTMLSPLAVLSLGTAPLAAQTAAETGAFVTRLGIDTVAVERFSRTAGRLQGEQVVRTPRTQHRIYAATFGRDGAIERFDLTIHNISGSGPAEQQASIEFHGDSAVVRLPRGDSTVTQRVAVSKGGAPYVFHVYALVEEMARRARAAGGERFAMQAVSLGAPEPWEVTVGRLRRDSMTIMIGPLGPFRLKLDRAGRLQGLSGIGSTIQVTVQRVPTVDIEALGPAFANRPLGVLSPADSVQATVAGATLSVKYSRPSVRGRVIFGAVVPWNQVWRTGANAATLFETSADLEMRGTTIPAGTYTLWTIPSPSGWKLIINKNTGQWGTDYDAAHDLVRLDMDVERLAQPVEQFTVAIEPQGDGGVLKLEWERTQAAIAFVKK